MNNHHQCILVSISMDLEKLNVVFVYKWNNDLCKSYYH